MALGKPIIPAMYYSVPHIVEHASNLAEQPILVERHARRYVVAALHNAERNKDCFECSATRLLCWCVWRQFCWEVDCTIWALLLKTRRDCLVRVNPRRVRRCNKRSTSSGNVKPRGGSGASLHGIE